MFDPSTEDSSVNLTRTLIAHNYPTCRAGESAPEDIKRSVSGLTRAAIILNLMSNACHIQAYVAGSGQCRGL